MAPVNEEKLIPPVKSRKHCVSPPLHRLQHCTKMLYWISDAIFVIVDVVVFNTKNQIIVPLGYVG